MVGRALTPHSAWREIVGEGGSLAPPWRGHPGEAATSPRRRIGMPERG